MSAASVKCRRLYFPMVVACTPTINKFQVGTLNQIARIPSDSWCTLLLVDEGVWKVHSLKIQLTTALSIMYCKLNTLDWITIKHLLDATPVVSDSNSPVMIIVNVNAHSMIAHDDHISFLLLADFLDITGKRQLPQTLTLFNSINCHENFTLVVWPYTSGMTPFTSICWYKS